MILVESFHIWLVVGILLLVAEMLTGGFFLMFIALGCFAASLSASFGMHFGIDLAICGVVSILGVILLRKPIQARLLKSLKVETDVGQEIRADHNIEPHQQGRITYQGAPWAAMNLDAEAIQAGDHVTIVGMDGNTLLIRKLH